MKKTIQESKFAKAFSMVKDSFSIDEMIKEEVKSYSVKQTSYENPYSRIRNIGN